ncbi:MAG: winged helix-turn-helix domain-containing protein [Novosphingobium sp.]
MDDVPAACDLRLLGWTRDADMRATGCLLLADRDALAPGDWLALLGSDNASRARTLLLGVGDYDERARLLRLGFGDVVGAGAALDEVGERARRILRGLDAGPYVRELGPLRLELLRREGFVAGRRLALHPREFALLWRLAEAQGEAVAPLALIAEVWHLAHRPETNSLAVHVSRLRAKLRLAGLGAALVSSPAGYRLAPPGPPRVGLDGPHRLGEEAGQEDAQPCATISPRTIALA